MRNLYIAWRLSGFEASSSDCISRTWGSYPSTYRPFEEVAPLGSSPVPKTDFVIDQAQLSHPPMKQSLSSLWSSNVFGLGSALHDELCKANASTI